MCLFCKFFQLLSSSDGNKRIEKYRPTPRAKECEHCHTASTVLCIFNTAILCEVCYVNQAQRFPHVVLRGKKG